MKKAVKVQQVRRAAIVTAVADNPGVTTAELVSLIGVDSTKLVSNAMWMLLKSGKVLSEQIVRDGRHMNAYYLPEQVGSDSVSRVRQKLVDAAEVIPMQRSTTAPNSVFDVPRAARRKAKGKARRTPSRQTATAPIVATANAPTLLTHGFACAETNDGSVLLMREGQIEFSLTGAEAATLQSYLMKRAAASLFANMM